MMRVCSFLTLWAPLAPVALLLGGCMATPKTLDQTHHAPTPRPEAYSAQKRSDPRYGPWWIDAGTCTIRATAADFTLQTEGRMDTPTTLSLRARFATPLAAPPVAELTHVPVAVPVEGARGVYNIILTYTSDSAARMLDDSVYLLVRYQPVNGGQVLESSFSTKDLMFALGDLGRNCQ